jgi:hypothetical protein
MKSEVENKTNDTDFDLIFSASDDGDKQPIKTVVRIKTNIYDSGSGITYKKTVNLLKRKSTGEYHPFFDDESPAIQWSCLMTDLHSLEDGIYEVITLNTDYNWEYSVYEGVGYKFIEYKE